MAAVGREWRSLWRELEAGDVRDDMRIKIRCWTSIDGWEASSFWIVVVEFIEHENIVMQRTPKCSVRR